MSVYPRKRNDGTTAWYYYFGHNGQRYRALGGATKTQALRTMEKVRSRVIMAEHDLVIETKDSWFEDFAETYLRRRQHLRSHK